MHIRLSWLWVGVLLLAGIGSACDSVQPEEEQPLELLLRAESVDYPLEVPQGESVEIGVVFMVECPIRVRAEKEVLEAFHYRLAVYGELILGGCEPGPGFAKGRSETFFDLGAVVDTTYRTDILSPEAIYTVAFHPTPVAQAGRFRIRTDAPVGTSPLRVQAILYERGGQGTLPLDTLTLDPIGNGLFEQSFEPPSGESVDATFFFELIFTYANRPAFRDLPRPVSRKRPAIRVDYLE